MVRTASHPAKTLETQTQDKYSKRHNPPQKKMNMENYRGAVAAGKQTGHCRASRFVYVALDTPRKRAGDVKLQASKASYGPR